MKVRIGDILEISVLIGLSYIFLPRYLNQGPQLVPLLMGASSDPIMPSCKTLLPDAVLLQVIAFFNAQ